MRKRPARDAIFLPVVLVILLFLLIVSTRPTLAQVCSVTTSFDSHTH